ncbi:hypothetical protein [Xanthomonas albilineans]|uniref:hypothetical protein n=1 Tax=Xanthomonas albilineans TaxID=29447 RepID=UPI0009BBF0CC|nr:hypothetical protein [Xanthomonas albilineans]
MKWNLTVACAVLGIGVLLGNSSPLQAAEKGSGASEDVVAQMGNRIAEQQKIIRKNAPIHSETGLAGYLAKANNADSPFNALSPAARKRFIDSLKFNENGVTSFYYADIEAELSSSQAYALLSLFGLQDTLRFMSKLRVDSDNDRDIMHAFSNRGPGLPPGQDHEDYWCSSRANCTRTAGSICTGNC